MESVAGRITVGEDERLLIAPPLILKQLRAIIHLIKERDEMLRVASGTAATIVVPILGIHDVRFVIGRVQVDTVPAGGECDLGTHAARALDRWEAAVLLVSVANAFVRNGKTGEVRGVIALVSVTGQHAEAGREGNKLVIVGSRARAGRPLVLEAEVFSFLFSDRATDRGFFFQMVNKKLTGSKQLVLPCSHREYRHLWEH